MSNVKNVGKDELKGKRRPKTLPLKSVWTVYGSEMGPSLGVRVDESLRIE